MLSTVRGNTGALGILTAFIVAGMPVPSGPAPAEPAQPGANIVVRAISSGESIFETDEHRCQSAESAAYGYRQEPHLAVNPQDPQNMVATWRQDQWGGAFAENEGGGALSDVVAYSKNGGATWTELVLPGLGLCSGAGDGVSDPTVSFGADGTAYLAAMQFGGPTGNALSNRAVEGAVGQLIAILVYRSSDGGRSWDGPFTAQVGDRFNDHPTIVADPDEPGVVHMVWTRLLGASDAPCACYAVVGARSEDGGRTWSDPTTVVRRDGFASFPAGLSVLQNGELVVLFDEFPAPGAFGDFRTLVGTTPASIYAARSMDGGQTWSRHKVADHTIAEPSGRDPDFDNTIQAFEFFVQQATGPNGRTLYVTWHHNTSLVRGEVFAARSDDGGVSWTEPLTVAQVPAQVLNPKIAVADDGTVGVIWADLRNDDGIPGEPDDLELTSDWWIATSRDRGQAWTETYMSGPFDLRNALFVRGNEDRDRQAPQYWLGDYYGLVSMPGGFGAAFIQAREQRDDISQTDVLFARVRLSGQSVDPQVDERSR